MSETPLDTYWEFEAADPEVGFMTDSITHTCPTNEDAEPATIEGVNLWNLPDEKTVREQTVFKCPVCDATTSCIEDWPRSMFEDVS